MQVLQKQIFLKKDLISMRSQVRCQEKNPPEKNPVRGHG